jgi:hypothetical protein
LPDEGLSAVNETLVDVPGYSEPLVLPWMVSAELVPTDAVPVPEPLVVKYAKAAPASARAPTALSVITIRLRVNIEAGPPTFFVRSPRFWDAQRDIGSSVV